MAGLGGYFLAPIPTTTGNYFPALTSVKILLPHP